MRRLLAISMLMLTLCNVSIAVVNACICSDPKLGTTCTGNYCRTRPGGGCECQDVPFNTGGGGGFVPEEPINN